MACLVFGVGIELECYGNEEIDDQDQDLEYKDCYTARHHKSAEVILVLKVEYDEPCPQEDSQCYRDEIQYGDNVTQQDKIMLISDAPADIDNIIQQDRNEILSVPLLGAGCGSLRYGAHMLVIDDKMHEQRDYADTGIIHNPLLKWREPDPFPASCINIVSRYAYIIS